MSLKLGDMTKDQIRDMVYEWRQTHHKDCRGRVLGRILYFLFVYTSHQVATRVDIVGNNVMLGDRRIATFKWRDGYEDVPEFTFTKDFDTAGWHADKQELNLKVYDEEQQETKPRHKWSFRDIQLADLSYEKAFTCDGQSVEPAKVVIALNQLEQERAYLMATVRLSIEALKSAVKLVNRSDKVSESALECIDKVVKGQERALKNYT